MSKERADEFLKWRAVLDQPEAGLGQALDDREATWQKLAGRLGDRRRNRVSRYRIAAACLLFALMIPAFRILQDRRHASSVVVPQCPADLLPADRGRSAAPGDGSTAATAVRQQHAASSLQSDSKRFLCKGRASRPATGGSGSHRQADAAKFPARKMDRFPLAALVNIGWPAASIVAAVPVPASQNCFPPSSPAKQMKVVHQNEIGGGSTPSPAVGVTGSGRLLNALFSPNPQSSLPVPSPQDDPALLKIKLSPSN